MKRYFKALLVGLTLVAALFLTIKRQGPEGGIDLTAQRQSRAEPERSAKSYDLTALKVFTVVLGRIKDHYVEPNRVHPREMLVAALNAVEHEVAEVLVEESPKTDRVEVRVQDAERTFDIRQVDSPWALSSKMKDVLRFLQPHLNPSTDIRDVEYAAVNGMLSTLDPHSVLLKPEIYNEMKLSTRGEFGGLGIVISMIQGVLTVMNPMKGTPAYEVGIKSCDQILKIGKESTVNMTLTQAVSRLRGVPGSEVEITILREGWKRPVKKTITRAVIKVDSVTSRMLAKKVGYVRLGSFQGNSLADLREHLKKLRRKGMKGLVLDLRSNPGGLLDQAIKISDLFLDSGTLLTTVSHAGKQREEKRATGEGTEDRYPIVVLVNSGSASASEIVAGALKNLDRAVVLGWRTFGKGSVQVLYDNDDGSALKLTIAQYLTPGDISIQSVGITPDILTRPMAVRRDFVRIRRGDHTPREEDLRQHLTHRNVRHDVKPLRTVRYLAPQADSDKEEEAEEKKETVNLCLYPDRRCSPSDEDKFIEDFQIKLARDLVAQAKSWRRSQILQEASGLLQKREGEEEGKLVDALRKLGVDWTVDPQKKPTEPVKLVVTTAGTEGKACEKTELKVTVRNAGKRAVEQLAAQTESPNPMLRGHEFIFGRIEPGASRSWTVPIRLRDAPTRTDAVTLKLTDGHGINYPDQVFQFSTRGVERPIFAYGYQLIDDLQGNHDGRAQRGERLRLLVKVRNIGKGRAFRAVTTLKNLSGVGVFIRKGRFVLGSIAPGDKKTTSFTFDLERQYASSDFKLELGVTDDGLGESVTDKLKFKVAQQADPPRRASGTVRVRQATPVRAWADAKAPAVGEAPKGAAFKVLGRYPDWYRVELGGNRPGFVSARVVTPGGAPTPKRFVSRWQVTPPKLSVNLPRHLTDSKTIRVSGEAVDDTRVLDLFIFVHNPSAKIDRRKVFYRSNRNARSSKRLSFATDVPLWPGANYVTVFARENEQVQSNDMVVVFRRQKETVAVKSGEKAPSRTRH